MGNEGSETASEGENVDPSVHKTSFTGLNLGYKDVILGQPFQRFTSMEDCLDKLIGTRYFS